MFKNDLTPPPKKKYLTNFMFKPNVTMISMTADDATMKVISWIHDFSSQNPL